MGTQLFATPLSHFARKVRIVLSELEIPCELVYVQNLLSTKPEDFGGNPILRIPTLLDGEQWIVESDQIVRYLIDQHDSEDRFRFHSLNPDQRNVLSMITAAMLAEVELILAGRSGIKELESLHYFKRDYDVIRLCLDWLEANGKRLWTATDLSYLDIALICMWDHLVHSAVIPDLQDYDWIKAKVASHASRPSVFDSAPARQQV